VGCVKNDKTECGTEKEAFLIRGLISKVAGGTFGMEEIRNIKASGTAI
jgi:hypothetical protein